MSIHRWNLEKYFIPNSTCVPVKGYMRSVICDLQRSAFSFIPNELYSLIYYGKGLKVSDLLTKEFGVEKDLLIEYMEFLEKKEFAIWCDYEEKDWFPSLSMEWEQPALITNVTIDIGTSIVYPCEILVALLNSVNCQYIQLYSKSEKEIIFWDKILTNFNDSRIKYIDIYTQHNSNDEHSDKMALLTSHPRLANYIEFNTPKDQKDNFISIGHQKLITDTGSLVEGKGKSCVKQSSFSCNVWLFTESQNNNNYFNKKMHIGENGEIKNASETPIIFNTLENIKSPQALIDIIKTNEFQTYWNVAKDDCDVCMDCEFRYMCVDNRLPIKRENGGWYFENECNYNPYISKWQGEQGYRTLYECGIISDQTGLIIKPEIIDEINNTLWE